MSAYLTDTTKIGTIAQAIAANTDQYGDARQVAKTLAKENLRSVGYRYGQTENNTAQMFMGISATRYIHQCQQAAVDPLYDPAKFSKALLLDIVKEYQYQSCECDDWPETVAAQALATITTPVTAN